MDETNAAFPRREARVPVQIEVMLTTVVDSLDGVVVDLNEQGALVHGPGLPIGTLFQIDLDGHSVYARVAWSEVDRMGVRFPFPLHDGPLFEALETARSPEAANIFMPRAAMARTIGFGRRA